MLKTPITQQGENIFCGNKKYTNIQNANIQIYKYMQNMQNANTKKGNKNISQQLLAQTTQRNILETKNLHEILSKILYSKMQNTKTIMKVLAVLSE